MMGRLSILSLSILLVMACDSKTDQRYSDLITRNRSEKRNPHTFSKADLDECEDFVQTHSARQLGRRMNRSKNWILANYRIPLYADTSGNALRKIGEVFPGGACFLVEAGARWYYVQSPGSNEVGWLSAELVKGFVKMNPRTLAPCAP